MAVIALCKAAVQCVPNVTGVNVGKGGETVKKILCALSVLIVLWLFATVVLVADPPPRTGTPEWLTLSHRQKGY